MSKKDTAPPMAFDHSEVVGWPEYGALGRAINEFARRLDREPTLGGRAGFVTAVENLARASFMLHSCRECGREDIELVAPFRVTPEGTGWQCDYRCRAGHHYHCWFSS